MVNDAETLLLTNHRRQLRIAAAGAVATLALAFIPQNARALFVVRDSGITALTAAIAPDVPNMGRYLVTVIGAVRPGDLGPAAFAPRLPGAPFGTVPDSPFGSVAPIGPATPFGPEDFGPLAAFAPGPDFGPLSLGSPGGFLPTSPLAFGPVGTSPVAPLADTPVGPVVPAVPEPASWATMILGFLGVGLALRRRRRQAAISA